MRMDTNHRYTCTINITQTHVKQTGSKYDMFLHIMSGYCYLTPRWDNSILHPCCACANVILPYRTHFYDNINNNSSGQQTTIIFRIIEGTIRFNNDKIQTHALGSICHRDGI